MTDTMSIEDYRTQTRKRGKRGNKYGAIKTRVDGITFDSKAEARRYRELKTMEAGGVISDLSLQPTFTLAKTCKHDGVTVRGVKYVADFMYREAGVWVVEDVKGKRTRDFVVKWKWVISRYGNEYTFREVSK